MKTSYGSVARSSSFGRTSAASALSHSMCTSLVVVWAPNGMDTGCRGTRGVVITDDKHLRTRPEEAHLAIEHKLKVVYLDGVGHRTRWDQLLRLTSHWSAVEAASVSEWVTR